MSKEGLVSNPVQPPTAPTPVINSDMISPRSPSSKPDSAKATPNTHSNTRAKPSTPDPKSKEPSLSTSATTTNPSHS